MSGRDVPRPGGDPAPRAVRLETPRLVLTPLRVDDAEEMASVLADPRLYVVIGGHPPSVSELRARYAAQVVGRSSDGTETWLNWIVRIRAADDGQHPRRETAVGYVQATLTRLGDAPVADISWVIGSEWQGRGYATEAAAALVGWLASSSPDVRTVTAHIAAGHVASETVAARLGLAPTTDLEDGERVWRRTS